MNLLNGFTHFGPGESETGLSRDTGRPRQRHRRFHRRHSSCSNVRRYLCAEISERHSVCLQFWQRRPSGLCTDLPDPNQSGSSRSEQPYPIPYHLRHHVRLRYQAIPMGAQATPADSACCTCLLNQLQCAPTRSSSVTGSAIVSRPDPVQSRLLLLTVAYLNYGCFDVRKQQINQIRRFSSIASNTTLRL